MPRCERTTRCALRLAATWTVADGLPLLIRQSGEAGRPIRVRSYGRGGAPRFRCGDGDGILALDCQWVELSGLSVEGSGVSNTGATTSQGAGINFKSTRQTTRDEKLEHIVVDRATVSGCKLGILFQSVPGPAPRLTGWATATCASPAARSTIAARRAL